MFDYIFWFKNFPPQIATILIAMLPIAELRVALPVALIIYKLPFWSAFFLSILGNMLPVFFIIWWLRPITIFLTKHFKLADRFFSWWFNRVDQKFKKGILKYGINLALVLFVATPLPLTGAWSGAVASFLFNIQYRRALILIFLGVVIAGIIVGFLTESGLYILK